MIWSASIYTNPQVKNPNRRFYVTGTYPYIYPTKYCQLDQY